MTTDTPTPPATPYDVAFHRGFADGSSRSAAVIVPLVMDFVKPASVLDVGCGLGTWLAEFARAGVTDYLGMDGDYVLRTDLLIPAERFRPADLATAPHPGRRFDLVTCLEVAEHLPEASAAPFVAMLTGAAPVVLFSAAVPGQGGVNHINEQWPPYWRALFAAHGFVRLDPVRPRVWRDGRVEWWYRQNVYLFVREELLSQRPEFRTEHEIASACPLELVHENIVRGSLGSEPTLRQLVTGFPGALVRKLKRHS
ncbi:MAG TPA: class I SAM-dependent methyltransferase [Gemmata sp.]